jgi:alginate O-acetyltransferase complex protein AlgI
MVFIPKYILILFLVILIDYFSGILIERNQGSRRKLFLVISLLSNILLLCFFKYFNFLNENLENVFDLFGKTYHPSSLDIILPIGLSFHTFQSMSYTIEVYRGNQKAERHIGYFANYVLFFPQMVAGPIERYASLGNGLREDHPPRYSNFSEGFRLVLFGLLVKMTIADNLAPFVNEVYKDPAIYSTVDIALALVFFSFQIYADFYGYSTIALGSAKMLGIRIMDNFKTPYLSSSISEFWSRWHISLSTWFRDYLYIPLGGNRVKVPRWCFNIMIVFMVSGLWHGASWTFVVWGALHGLMLLVERFFPLKFINPSMPVKALLILKTFIITTFIWIFFRAENFAKAKLVIGSLFHNSNLQQQLDARTPLFFTCVMILADLWLYNSRADIKLGVLSTPYRWAVYALLIFFLFALSGTQKFTFIYFQF